MKVSVPNEILGFFLLGRLSRTYVLLIDFLNVLEDLGQKSLDLCSDQSESAEVSEKAAYTQGSSEITPFSRPRSLIISVEN